MIAGKIIRKGILLCLLTSSLAGCTHNVLPLVGAEPYNAGLQRSMVFNEDEMNAINNYTAGQVQQVTSGGLSPQAQAQNRNNLVLQKMYLLDQAYFDYETRLTHDDQFVSALGSLATFSTSAVAAVIPLQQATKTLSAVAAGVSGGVTTYDKDVLMSQTMQALQNQMRADRDTKAAVILGRMQCSYAQYPAPLAFSDLEEYARAGTLSSALLGLTKTTTQAQTQAQTAKNTAAHAAAANAKGAKASLGAAPAQPLAAQLAQTADAVSNAAKCPVAPPS
jgi:hypothetical protein